MLRCPPDFVIGFAELALRAAVLAGAQHDNMK
jgi:hypothetical protein